MATALCGHVVGNREECQVPPAGSTGPAVIGCPTWFERCWPQCQHAKLGDVRSESNPSVFAPERQGSSCRANAVALPSAG